MIYLASPYSHPDPQVRQARYEAVCRAAAALMREGHAVFSPIAHSHGIARYGLPLNWEFWERYDLEMLATCEELWVLKLDGWQQSRGVNAEIAAAKTLGKPIRFVTAEQLGCGPEETPTLQAPTAQVPGHVR